MFTPKGDGTFNGVPANPPNRVGVKGDACVCGLFEELLPNPLNEKPVNGGASVAKLEQTDVVAVAPKLGTDCAVVVAPKMGTDCAVVVAPKPGPVCAVV